MFRHVVSAKYIEDYRVWLVFDDGKQGEVDLSEKIGKKSGVFEPLKDVDYFKDFSVVNDTLSWKNGADLAPESLYELIQE